MPYQVMAAAMAKRGQIKLFGDTPTIAEATLARARKRVFYDERYAAAFPEHKLYLCSFFKGWLLLLSEKFDNFVLMFLLLEAGTHLERCSLPLYCSVLIEISGSGLHFAGYKQRRSAGRKLVPWPTTKNGSRHGRMTPPRKLYRSIMN
jgi:hypothetical protein